MKNWFARKLLFFFTQSCARWRCSWDLKVDEWNPLFSKLFFQRKTFFILSHFEIMNACWTWWHELYKLFFICPCHFLSTWIMKEERGGNGCHLKWHFNTKTKLPNLFTWFDFQLFSLPDHDIPGFPTCFEWDFNSVKILENLFTFQKSLYSNFST